MAWSYVVRRAAEHCPEVAPETLHRRIGYASYVNLKRRYLYYQVSKAGCTTMKWLLHDIEALPPINYLIGTRARRVAICLFTSAAIFRFRRCWTLTMPHRNTS